MVCLHPPVVFHVVSQSKVGTGCGGTNFSFYKPLNVLRDVDLVQGHESLLEVRRHDARELRVGDGDERLGGQLWQLLHHNFKGPVVDSLQLLLVNELEMCFNKQLFSKSQLTANTGRIGRAPLEVRSLTSRIVKVLT